MRRVGSVLWPSLNVIQIYGANTGVGKTVLSTLLCKALRDRRPEPYRVHYLKPVSTGPLKEADDSHLASFVGNVSARCLFQFDEPVSPHIAVRSHGKPLPDVEVLKAVQEELAGWSGRGEGTVLVETAGGVLSPSPSGSVQADLYRPLRLPVLLIADYRLGGIATSISAFESLHLRGYDVHSVALFQDDQYQNHSYLRDYFGERDIATFSLPQPPEIADSENVDRKGMAEYYEEASALPVFDGLIALYDQEHRRRIEKLEQAAEKAHQNVWYPFTQHQGRSKSDILVIDSAYGDFFQMLKPADGKQDSQNATSDDQSPKVEDLLSPTKQQLQNDSILQPAFDGSASWWTQGLGHGNPKLGLAAAYASGRYGHVMFAGAVHEPALSLIDLLLDHHKNPRLSRAFFTDNGSTGMEVAVKMALRAASVRYGRDSAAVDHMIVGLKGSYHGDTIGVMDCSEPSVYNKKVEWYRGRGYWFDFPTVKMRKGTWAIEPPEGMEKEFGKAQSFDSLSQVFDLQSRNSEQYEHFIKAQLTSLVNNGKKLGALVMEPVILGAGGMFLADPLFQHALVKVVRSMDFSGDGGSRSSKDVSANPLAWTGLPVIFDEVFTGLYRLGRFTSASFLQVDPDITVNAKLLTGGLLPLCTTMASENVFEAFLSDQKSDSLLHGHSYTAHAVGCKVAETSLKTMIDMEDKGQWNEFKQRWRNPSSETIALEQRSGSDHGAWSMWSKDFVDAVSHKDRVDHVFTLGSVLVISLKDAEGAGYTSMAASGLQRRLLEVSSRDGWVMHSRVLGNVIYFMASKTSSAECLQAVEEMLLRELQ